MTDMAQRASDAEREAVAERLRSAAAEGRLDADELEQRLGDAYAARTGADLALLTADLPPAPARPAAPAPRLVRDSSRLRSQLARFLTVNLICITVWVAIGATGSFWPVWVLLGTGIPLISTWLHLVLGAPDSRHGCRGLPVRRGPLPPGD